jgi:protein TonB
MKPERSRILVGSILGGGAGGCGNLARQTRPVYPKEARRKRIEGTVRLLVVIAKTGELGDIEVLQGNSLLVPAALEAVKHWRYVPCMLNSEPVEIKTTLDIDFNLSQ